MSCQITRSVITKGKLRDVTNTVLADDAETCLMMIRVLELHDAEVAANGELAELLSRDGIVVQDASE